MKGKLWSSSAKMEFCEVGALGLALRPASARVVAQNLDRVPLSVRNQ